jgi:LysM repeat protein
MFAIGNYKLQNPGRLARAAMVLAIGIGFSISSISGSVAGDAGPVELQYITVQQGESLWELAGDYAPNSDPRDWIAEVVMINALQSIDLIPGQQIALP